VVKLTTLIKGDLVFLPGSTIGVIQWIAYTVTRGRVLVVSRSSGDHTILLLPTVFAPATRVIDMAVHSSRLTGVTSDGGFVVWELPKVITGDVPPLAHSPSSTARCAYSCRCSSHWK
jgi:hypothetical protein